MNSREQYEKDTKQSWHFNPWKGWDGIEIPTPEYINWLESGWNEGVRNCTPDIQEMKKLLNSLINFTEEIKVQFHALFPEKKSENSNFKKWDPNKISSKNPFYKDMKTRGTPI